MYTVKGMLLQSTFNSANKKLYKHCFKVCNKGVKVKEAIDTNVY